MLNYSRQRSSDPNDSEANSMLESLQAFVENICALHQEIKTIMTLKINKSLNESEIENRILMVRSIWVDLYSKMLENDVEVRILADNNQTKVVRVLLIIICELPDLESIEVQEIKSDFVIQGRLGLP